MIVKLKPEVIDEYKELHADDNTLIVMTGDNVMPFQRARMSLYEMGTRAPLAIRWPGKE
ncbi:MAG TPA: hypothetical protein ENH59_02490 [Bacteroidetes bacterium]|nr:hypothetical protein [Bacteroidota bacterium]